MGQEIVLESTSDLQVNYAKSTVSTRFLPPKGYTWVKESPGSFAEYLMNFPLYPENFPIRDYKQIPVEKQSFHAALLKIDVGEKDLQQCADAWMRLYAEYLWSEKRFDEIVFRFNSGQPLSWKDFRDGVRTTEIDNGKRVKFHKTAKFDDSYLNFRKYLNLVFNYAGTVSLDQDSCPVVRNQDITPGDFLIYPGTPGHSVFVVGRAKNSAGKYLYLLAESFMPAQDIHILKNMQSKVYSPWYVLDVKAPQTKTAKFTFSPTSIKRFYGLAK